MKHSLHCQLSACSVRFWFLYVIFFFGWFFSRLDKYIFLMPFSCMTSLAIVSMKSRISICTYSFYVAEMNTIPLEILRECTFFFVLCAYLIVDESVLRKMKYHRQRWRVWSEQNKTLVKPTLAVYYFSCVFFLSRYVCLCVCGYV